MAFGTDPLGGDPFDRIDSVLDRPFRGLGRASAPAYRKEFDPAEYEQKRNWLLGGAMSGLRGIGWALSTPGDYLRGAVSGNLGRRKSGRDVLDQLGVTSKSDKGWGAWGAGLAADVATDPLMLLGLGPATATTRTGAALGKLGPLEGGIQAMSRADRLGGFHALESGLARGGRTAEEIAYFNAGGELAGLKLPRPGLVATKVQEDQVAKELGRPLRAAEPLASLAKIQLPFGIGPRLNIGTGPLAQKVAGRMDWLGNKLAFGNVVSRGLGRAFDAPRQGVGSKAAQESYALPGAGTDVMRAAEARGALQISPFHQGLESLLRQAPSGKVPYNPDYEDELLRAVGAVRTGAPVSHYHPGILEDARGLAPKMGDLYDRRFAEMQAAGVPTRKLEHPWGLGYAYQQALHEVPGLAPGRVKPSNVRAAHDIARNPDLQFPGGIDRVNRWTSEGLADPELFTREDAAGRIFRDSIKDLDEIKKLGTYPGGLDDMERLRQQSIRAANELPKLRGMLGPEGRGPFYRDDPVGLLREYNASSARKLGAAESLHRMVAEHAVPAGTNLAGTATSLPDFNKRAGTKDWVPGVPGEPIAGAGVEQLKRLAPKGAPMVGPLSRFMENPRPVSWLHKGPHERPSGRLLAEELGKWEIPNAAVEDMLKARQVGQLPEELIGPLAGMRGATNLFRALAYPIWPGSQVRNATGAGVNLLRDDTPWGAIKSVVEQFRANRNPNFADPALAAARASQHAHGGVGSGWGAATDTAGLNVPQRMAIGARVTPSLPMSHVLGPEGVSPAGTAVGDAANLVFNEGLWGTLKSTGSAIKQVARHPLDRSNWKSALSENLGIKGVGGQVADTLPAVRTGWKAGENIEDLFRGAHMRSLERQGYSPAEAGRQMLKYQFDYGAHGFTPFERNVMRQVFPFYGFMRKNIPLQAETLATRPGIVGAQVAPMMQNRNTEGDFIPQYLQGSISAPLGHPAGGNQRFLSTFGLPAEEAFGRMKFYPGDLGRSLGETASGFAANLNPLLKGPLESLTNRQFFSGRQLSDLKAPSLAQSIGGVFGGENPDRDRMIAQVLMNSPLTRFVTTAERLGDPRKEWWAKALNLGTGVRVADVDVDRQKAIEMRDAMLRLQSSLPHMASYTSFYPKPEFKGQLTPGDTELLRTYATYQKRAQEYAEKRRLQEATGIR